MTDQAAEPTMEEILASIRRIISEDDAPAETEEGAPVEAEAVAEEPASAPEPEPQPVAETEDVLELSEPAPEPETIGDLDVLAPLSPEPFPVASHEGLVGESAAGAAAGAFAGLAASLEPPAPAEPDTSGGLTVDQIARQLLRPMLKDWLDANLPGIVEAQVRREVERIARNAR